LFPLQRVSGGLAIAGTGGPVLSTAPIETATGGIRPEDLRLAETGIAARVVHAEYLGADTVLSCAVGAEITLLARLPGRVMPAPGALIHLASESKPHLFDPRTGHRLAALDAILETQPA
jgi:sn-glycerol 3-phosphate transport system ATP-binding protein